MTKIKEIIDISSGYTSYIELNREFLNPEANQERMRRYRPIRAHRLAFEKIANAINPRDKRVYFLSGSYGTGKSHLLLMLANYFGTPTDLPEMEQFFERYDESQKSMLLKPREVLKERLAVSLKTARSTGRFLVALCNFGWNLEFEGAIIRGIEEALDRENLTIELDSHYKEALRRLKDWEKRRTEAPFYELFDSALQNHPGWTLGSLEQELSSRNEKALDVFKACFRTATDTDFAYDKDNITAILEEILSSDDFKAHFKGIVVFFDEFGYALDGGLVNLGRFQDFAQFCSQTGMAQLPMVFIGSGHKPFRNHGQISDAVHFETVEARVNEIALQSQGMEEIISAIVHPLKESVGWVNEVEPEKGIFPWFAGECRRLKLFNWLPAPKIQNDIIENIYPMHPVATYALLRFAEEAGSDNRSVFKFFSPEFDSGEDGWKNVQEYSYPWYIERHSIKEDGKLSLITADMLFDYFKESLTTDNLKLRERIKASVGNYEATIRSLNEYLAKEREQQLFEEEDGLKQQILKIILVHEVISNDEVQITNTKENISFSLHAISEAEKTAIENRLNVLCQARVIYNNEGTYELVGGNLIDVDRLINIYKADPRNNPRDLLKAFQERTPLIADEIYLEARDYNMPYNEDKRLKVIFATPTILESTEILNGEQVNYFTWLEAERKQAGIGRSGYEGTAVYVFCENEKDIEHAKRQALKNNQPRVAVAIPKKATSLFDAILTLNAVDHIKQSKDYETFTTPALARLNEIRDKELGVLDGIKSTYFSNKHVNWFGPKGAYDLKQEANRHDVANIIIEKLFSGKRNTFANRVFNLTHANLSGQALNSLSEAGDILLDLSKTIWINSSWPENRGGILYLKNCFINHQALKHLEDEGEIRFFKPEEDINKFREKFPAYAQMLGDLAAQEGHGAVNFNDFINTYFEDYGQGEAAVTLMLLMARRYYGDGLRFKADHDSLTDLRFKKTEDVLRLIRGEWPNAVLLFEPVSKEDRAYFAKIYQIFSNEPIPADAEYGINDAFERMSLWWEGLPTIAKSSEFYSGEDTGYVDSLNQIKLKDPFNFIKVDLLELLGLISGEIITAEKLQRIEDQLKSFKSHAENVLEETQGNILERIKKIFRAPGVLDIDIQDAIRDWFNSLTDIQTDPYSRFHNNDSKPLVLKVKSLSNVRDLLFRILPDAYGMDKIENWHTNKINEYTNKIEEGKKHIENNAPKIPELELTMENILEEEGDRVVHDGALFISAVTEDGSGNIFYTEGDSNPADENSNRNCLSPDVKLEITGNKILKFIVSDGKGNYGKVKTIKAINRLDKYRIKRENLALGDEMINFIFPVDPLSARTLLSSLFDELIKEEWLNKDDLHELVKDILNQLDGEK